MNKAAQQKNPARQTKIVGICVINSAGKMLLHQKTSTTHIQWDLPRVAYDQMQQTAAQAVNGYLQERELTCELHEVFTAQSNQHGGAAIVPPVDHVIIALTTTDLLASAAENQWASINNILKDMQENPTRYAPWLRTIIEGIELYFKNYLKNRTTDTSTISL